MTSMIAGKMAEAAVMLVEALDEAQRRIACRAFPDDGERRLWFYTPTDHGGLPLHAMNAGQHRHVHRLAATGLSEAGYGTMAIIMGLENILDRGEGWRIDFGRERGRDPMHYYVTIFGEPGGDAWAWRFGGHHVSLHYTILAGEVVASTPNFFGANPADSPLIGPHLHRPLAVVEDLGRELFRSFEDGRREQALLSPTAPRDLISGNRSSVAPGDRMLSGDDIWRAPPDRGGARQQPSAAVKAQQEAGRSDGLVLTAAPKGLRTTDMTPAEIEILTSLIRCYADRLPEELADQQMALVASEFDKLAFAWAGGDERHQPHYYRIQGERLFIEYDNTQRDANHIHSVWRDLANDFAGDVLVRHYAHHPH